MNRAEVTSLTQAIAAVVKPKLEALEARLAALEGGGADKLLLARVKLLEQENASLSRRLANRIPPPQAPRRRA